MVIENLTTVIFFRSFLTVVIFLLVCFFQYFVLLLNMSKKVDNAQRLFLIFSFLLLVTASILSFILPPETRSLIPHTEIVIPIVNSLCAFLCIITIFKMHYEKLQCAVLLIQSIFTIATGYEILGILLYTILLIKLFLSGFYKTHPKIKTFFSFGFWILLILTLFPFGLERLFLAFSVICFFCTFSYWLYLKLNEQLKPFLPENIITTKIKLPPQGSNLDLKKYGFTDRQILILKEFMNFELTYKKIAQKLLLSTSTVKSEMSKIINFFEVKNAENLRLLLLQYTII